MTTVGKRTTFHNEQFFPSIAIIGHDCLQENTSMKTFLSFVIYIMLHHEFYKP